MLKLFKQPNRLVPIAVFACTLLAWLPYFLNLQESPRRDWDYFNSLAMVLREQIIRGQFPLFDPWVCGGIDLLANPQNWIYSPLVSLTVIFPPYFSNLLSLIICSGIGFWGMMNLTNQESVFNRSLISALFVLCSFFSLHFAEGHLVYRTFFLLPWILNHARNPRFLRGLMWIVAILAVMFLDGGIYPFYFSLFILLFNLPWHAFKKVFKTSENRGTLALLVMSFIALLGAKALPVLQVHAERVPESEYSVYSLQQIGEAFYNPHLTNFSVLGDFKYFAHEYSLYIGVALTLLSLWGLKSFKAHKHLLFQIVLFAFVALGFGAEWNPWSIIKLLPFVKHLHVQSRVLIIAFLLLLVFVSRIKINSRIKTAFLLVAFLEFFYVSAFVNNAAFKERTALPQMKNLNSQIVSFESYIRKPEVYASGSLSHVCYEPAKNRVAPDLRLFLGARSEDLRAQIDFNEIRIKSDHPLDPFVLNFAWNGGWECDGCEAVEKDGLVGVIPTSGTHEVLLHYGPYHLYSSFMLFSLGVVLLAVSFQRTKNEL